MVDKSVKISIVMPIWSPTRELQEMTDRNLSIAKSLSPSSVEWVIAESVTRNYINEADIYIHEKVKSCANRAIDRGFRAATGDFVVFLATDVEVCENWLEYMLECFKQKLDCGLASLGNNEHSDKVQDEIVEDIFFSVGMLKKEDAYYDPFFTSIFDDTDLIFRLHTQGKKFYKNLRGLVHHKPHTTHGAFGGSREEYERSRQYFLQKYVAYKDDPLYKIFGGV